MSEGPVEPQDTPQPEEEPTPEVSLASQAEAFRRVANQFAEFQRAVVEGRSFEVVLLTLNPILVELESPTLSERSVMDGLPEEDPRHALASALSDYGVDQAFTATNVEALFESTGARLIEAGADFVLSQDIGPRLERLARQSLFDNDAFRVYRETIDRLSDSTTATSDALRTQFEDLSRLRERIGDDLRRQGGDVYDRARTRWENNLDNFNYTVQNLADDFVVRGIGLRNALDRWTANTRSQIVPIVARLEPRSARITPPNYVYGLDEPRRYLEVMAPDNLSWLTGRRLMALNDNVRSRLTGARERLTPDLSALRNSLASTAVPGPSRLARTVWGRGGIANRSVYAPGQFVSVGTWSRSGTFVQSSRTRNSSGRAIAAVTAAALAAGGAGVVVGLVLARQRNADKTTPEHGISEPAGGTDHPTRTPHHVVTPNEALSKKYGNGWDGLSKKIESANAGVSGNEGRRIVQLLQEGRWQAASNMMRDNGTWRDGRPPVTDDLLKYSAAQALRNAAAKGDWSAAREAADNLDWVDDTGQLQRDVSHRRARKVVAAADAVIKEVTGVQPRPIQLTISPADISSIG